MKIATLSLIAALGLMSGCATCQRHPVACTIATAIVVGSLAYEIDNLASKGHGHSSASGRTFTPSVGPQLRPCPPSASPGDMSCVH